MGVGVVVVGVFVVVGLVVVVGVFVVGAVVDFAIVVVGVGLVVVCVVVLGSGVVVGRVLTDGFVAEVVLHSRMCADMIGAVDPKLSPKGTCSIAPFCKFPL